MRNRALMAGKSLRMNVAGESNIVADDAAIQYAPQPCIARRVVKRNMEYFSP